MKTFPEVPTLRELGYGFINESIFLLVAPKAAPLSIVRKLDDSFRKAMEDNPDFIRAMESMDTNITYRSYEDTNKFLQESYARIGRLIVELKIPIQSGKK